jgi:hypothetical protein
MVPMLKSAGFVAVVLAAGVVGAIATTRTVQAHDGCRRVHGHYVANFTTVNCTAPSGLCATGSITGGGILDSSALFVELDQAAAAGMPASEPGTSASYSGNLTVTTHHGTLQLRDLGVVAGPIGGASFTELERPVGGTGVFAHASHTFFISGVLPNNSTGFDGLISGELCGLGDGDDDHDNH